MERWECEREREGGRDSGRQEVEMSSREPHQLVILVSSLFSDGKSLS